MRRLKNKVKNGIQKVPVAVEISLGFRSQAPPYQNTPRSKSQAAFRIFGRTLRKDFMLWKNPFLCECDQVLYAFFSHRSGRFSHLEVKIRNGPESCHECYKSKRPTSCHTKTARFNCLLFCRVRVYIFRKAPHFQRYLLALISQQRNTQESNQPITKHVHKNLTLEPHAQQDLDVLCRQLMIWYNLSVIVSNLASLYPVA